MTMNKTQWENLLLLQQARLALEEADIEESDRVQGIVKAVFAMGITSTAMLRAVVMTEKRGGRNIVFS